MDTNKLKVVPDQALVYDIDEIDGAMYMFSHLAGGSVIFRFEEAIDPARGAVLLNGRPHTDWKITKIYTQRLPNPACVCPGLSKTITSRRRKPHFRL